MLLAICLSFSIFTVTASAASKPAAPVVSASNSASTGKIKLSWDAVDGASSYKVYRATSKSGDYTCIKTTTSTSFTNSSVAVGDTYYYYVKAVSESGAASKASNKVSATCKLPRPTLTLTNSSYSGKIIISWDAVDGAASYKLYRSTDKKNWSLIKSTSGTSVTNTSTEAGKTYYYRVKALASNSAADSAYSSVKYRTCDLPQPTIKLSGISSTGKIKISWDAVDGAVSYKVYRSTDKANWKLIKTTTNTSLTNTSTVAGTTYYYKVRAIASNTDANSAYSSVKYRTCDLARPVVSVSSDKSTGRVKLTWGAIDGAVEYKVYRTTSKSGEYKRIKTTTDTSCVDTTGVAEKTYYYRVLAVASRSAANSAKSTAKSGTYQYLTDLTISVALNEDGNPRVTWNEVKNAVKYKVYRSLSKSSGYKLLTTTENTYFINNSAAEGTTYYYKVKAVNSSGTTLKTSNVASITTELSSETLVTNYVSIPMVNLYKLPDSGSDTITLRYMDKVELGQTISSSDSGSWNRVFYQGNLYYLWLESGAEKLTAKKSSFNYTGNTTYQQQVLDLAMEICQEWNTVYAHSQSDGVANSDGTYGFDCSGFAKYVLNTVMQKAVPTYRLSADLDTLYTTDSIYNAGYPGELCAVDVSMNNLQPGDILFFGLDENDQKSDEINHCGIYLGNNEFVHSTHSWEDSVCVMPLSGIYSENLVKIRRYLPETVTPAETVRYAYNADTNYNKYKLYAEKSDGSEVLMQPAKGDALTVLYTDNGNWAYVRTEDGTLGYIPVKNLSKTDPV